MLSAFLLTVCHETYHEKTKTRIKVNACQVLWLQLSITHFMMKVIVANRASLDCSPKKLDSWFKEMNFSRETIQLKENEVITYLDHSISSPGINTILIQQLSNLLKICFSVSFGPKGKYLCYHTDRSFLVYITGIN